MPVPLDIRALSRLLALCLSWFPHYVWWLRGDAARWIFEIGVLVDDKAPETLDIQALRCGLFESRRAVE